jgi:glycosyltransferase involved in cell wall biosynthesis
VPGFGKKLIVPRVYKQIFKQATGMARIRRDQPDQALPAIDIAISSIFADLGHILFNRLGEKFRKLEKEKKYQSIQINKIVDNFEFPSHLRTLFETDNKSDDGHMTSINLSGLLDGLSFPFLASAVISGAFFTSARVMYKSRPLLTRFSETYDVFKHPERTLWLSDTFEDSNGVALVLKSMLAEVRRRDLPVDFLIASSTLESGDHLIVIPPLAEFKLPFYEQQPVRIPNILEIHRIFKEGEYNRVICSTEGAMGLIALYLKNAYTVPAHFYVHTDWMMFADKVLNFDELNKNRLRRLLRAFYRGFDSLFVLNTDQRKWLISSTMGFDPSRVILTAHWADKQFKPVTVDKKRLFGLDENCPVLLFAGRLSDEKGVMELPSIIHRVRQVFPNARLALAGIGPREKDLRAALPDALFLGWVDHTALPDYYSAADLLILPSRFDTFGCVVLEALSCGLPVAAYRTKGPKDIIIHKKTGYLAGSKNEMISGIIEYLGDADLQLSFRHSALERARDYDPDVILSEFFQSMQPAA